ncbi:MAG TPA: peptidase M14, partial [Ruminococcaceae bacterium]|nr:peptidase M14 [Oscillospiraceae bacterium]
MEEYAFGSRGPGVQLMQLGLLRAGYQPGRLDGRFGRGTENALRQFQQAEDLPATGRTDAATWQALMPCLIGTR